ncbi:MAG: beta-propeller fold lactonase family protein [Gemmatimonadales bacterium]
MKRWMAIAVLCAACASFTGPGGLTHPEGVVLASPGLGGQPYGVAISRTGDALVAQVNAGLVSRYSLPDTLPTSSLISGLQPVHVAIDPTGSRAYVINQAGQALRVINLSPFGVVDTIPLTNDGFNVAVAPNGQRVYVTTADGRVYVVSTASTAIVDSMRVGSAANGLAFSPNGDRLYVSSRDAGTVTVFATQTNAPLDTIVTTGAPQRLAITPDGSTLFAANESHGVNVIAIPSGTLQPNIPLDGSGYGVALTPDGEQLYATNPTTGNVFIVDVVSRLVVKTLPVGGTPRNVSFGEDGRIALVTDGGGRVIFIR